MLNEIPLTPALSPRERENHSQAVGVRSALEILRAVLRCFLSIWALWERVRVRSPRIEIRALNPCNLSTCKWLIINAAILRFMGREIEFTPPAGGAGEKGQPLIYCEVQVPASSITL